MNRARGKGVDDLAQDKRPLENILGRDRVGDVDQRSPRSDRKHDPLHRGHIWAFEPKVGGQGQDSWSLHDASLPEQKSCPSTDQAGDSAV